MGKIIQGQKPKKRADSDDEDLRDILGDDQDREALDQMEEIAVG